VIDFADGHGNPIEWQTRHAWDNAHTALIVKTGTPHSLAAPAEPAHPSPMTSTELPVSKDRRVSPWWRALAIVLMIALLIGWAASASMVEQLRAQIVHAQGKLAELPQITQVAVLMDDKGLPAMLATYTAKDQKLQLQRLNDVKEGREDSMQVWVIVGDAAPRSLGIIESKYKTLQLPVAPESLKGVSSIAISAESKGGVPDGSAPSLPWLFKGWLVQKAI
jgi:anti-sigma-K factor RskA